MKDVTAETAKKTAQKTDEAAKLSNHRTELDRHYGQIGISAVAAAARYAGAAWESEIRSRKSEVGNQKSELRSPISGF